MTTAGYQKDNVPCRVTLKNVPVLRMVIVPILQYLPNEGPPVITLPAWQTVRQAHTSHLGRRKTDLLAEQALRNAAKHCSYIRGREIYRQKPEDLPLRTKTTPESSTTPERMLAICRTMAVAIK